MRFYPPPYPLNGNFGYFTHKSMAWQLLLFIDSFNLLFHSFYLDQADTKASNTQAPDSSEKDTSKQQQVPSKVVRVSEATSNN